MKISGTLLLQLLYRFEKTPTNFEIGVLTVAPTLETHRSKDRRQKSLRHVEARAENDVSEIGITAGAHGVNTRQTKELTHE